MTKDFKQVRYTAELMSEIMDDLDQKKEFYDEQHSYALDKLTELEKEESNSWEIKDKRSDMERYLLLQHAVDDIKEYLSSYKF